MAKVGALFWALTKNNEFSVRTQLFVYVQRRRLLSSRRSRHKERNLRFDWNPHASSPSSTRIDLLAFLDIFSLWKILLRINKSVSALKSPLFPVLNSSRDFHFFSSFKDVFEDSFGYQLKLTKCLSETISHKLSVSMG